MTYDGSLGVQLYSVRNDLGPADLGTTLQRLKGFGFTHVEPYDILGYTDRLFAAVEANGLKTGTAHANVIELDRQALIAAAKRLGIDTLIMPWVDEETIADRAGVMALIAGVNTAAKELADAGLRTAYHNHQFEFALKVDGKSVYEWLVELLDPSILLELDTFWASVGGGDVFELIPRLSDRIRWLHVKNEPPDAEDLPLLGPDITGKLDQVLALGQDFVERPVVEIVVDEGDVFPILERNAKFFLSEVRK